jgi:hypothetical protein
MALSEPQEKHGHEKAEGQRQPHRPVLSGGTKGQKYSYSDGHNQGNGHQDYQATEDNWGISFHARARVNLVHMNGSQARDPIPLFPKRFVPVRIEGLVPARADVEQKQWGKKTAKIKMQSAQCSHDCCRKLFLWPSGREGIPAEKDLLSPMPDARAAGGPCHFFFFFGGMGIFRISPAWTLRLLSCGLAALTWSAVIRSNPLASRSTL